MAWFSALTGFGGRDMAVDLGTANTLVYVRGRGIVLSELSVSRSTSARATCMRSGVEAKPPLRRRQSGCRGDGRAALARHGLFLRGGGSRQDGCQSARY
jgi:MreB/Mbl protein